MAPAEGEHDEERIERQRGEELPIGASVRFSSRVVNVTLPRSSARFWRGDHHYAATMSSPGRSPAC